MFIHAKTLSSFSDCNDGGSGDGGGGGGGVGSCDVESPFQFEWPPNSIGTGNLNSFKMWPFIYAKYSPLVWCANIYSLP